MDTYLHLTFSPPRHCFKVGCPDPWVLDTLDFLVEFLLTKFVRQKVGWVLQQTITSSLGSLGVDVEDVVSQNSGRWCLDRSPPVTRFVTCQTDRDCQERCVRIGLHDQTCHRLHLDPCQKHSLWKHSRIVSCLSSPNRPVRVLVFCESQSQQGTHWYVLWDRPWYQTHGRKELNT